MLGIVSVALGKVELVGTKQSNATITNSRDVRWLQETKCLSYTARSLLCLMASFVLGRSFPITIPGRRDNEIEALPFLLDPKQSATQI
jgi:hypothetical protein